VLNKVDANKSLENDKPVPFCKGENPCKNQSEGVCTIAIDAMGGDHGPDVIVPAAFLALKRHKHLELVLVGDQKILQAKIAGRSLQYHSRLRIKHATEQVLMDESPAKALRTKKDSSMRVAINLVKKGEALACVSAGNTGALMATARFVLKTIPGINRPAIVASLPTRNPKKGVRVLDLGANVDSNAEYLYQFAVMGSVVASAIDNIANPKVGLLNVGSEEIKGNEKVKSVAQMLTAQKAINYIGYVEGEDIFKGEVDVVVCDGFVGNAVLKSLEGVLKLVAYYVKKAFYKNFLTKLAALAALIVLRNVAKQVDPGRYNGASLIGLRGIVIKSHGGANVNAFANAIEEAMLEVEKDVPRRISNEVSRMLNSKEVVTNDVKCCHSCGGD
jgi:phosphate acyltransferase